MVHCTPDGLLRPVPRPAARPAQCHDHSYAAYMAAYVCHVPGDMDAAGLSRPVRSHAWNSTARSPRSCTRGRWRRPMRPSQPSPPPCAPTRRPTLAPRAAALLSLARSYVHSHLRPVPLVLARRLSPSLARTPCCVLHLLNDDVASPHVVLRLGTRPQLNESSTSAPFPIIRTPSVPLIPIFRTPHSDFPYAVFRSSVSYSVVSILFQLSPLLPYSDYRTPKCGRSSTKLDSLLSRFVTRQVCDGVAAGTPMVSLRHRINSMSTEEW